MRTKLTSRLSLLFMSFALMLALPAMAFADNISNNVDGTMDAVAETMALNVGGANGTTQLYVAPTNGDGKNGCNLTGSTSLGLSVSSSNTSVATVSPSSVTFTSCSDTKTLTVTPVAQGSATISVNQTSNTTDGSFNLAPATFTVNVSAAAPSNTAPQVSVSGVEAGAEYNKGSVPAATCNVTDEEDGNSSFAATLSSVSGPYASDGIGSQTASCSYTDGGGLEASSSETYSIVDPSAPVITKVVTPGTPDGDNGWYKSDVTVEWTVSDPQSPNSLQKNGCVDQSITSDQAATTYSCSATSAGGSAAEQNVTIKRDATAPVITLGSASGTPGDNGWYKSAVSQAFGASDATSGLANPTQDSFSQSSGTAEGSNLSIASGPVSDNAGNTNGGVNAGPFKIDLNAPVANCDSAPSAWSSTDVSIRCQPTDAVSGLADPADGDFNLSTSVADGTETSNASTDSRVVSDAAGHTVTAGPIAGSKVDKKAPALVSDGATSGTVGDNGWYTSAVTNGFTATDGGSGFAPSGALTHSFNQSSGTNEGAAFVIFSGAVSDAVGNTNAGINSAPYKIDLSDPTNVAFVGGPAANGSYDFGSVPAQPTCTAVDAVSGLKDCVVSGYSAAVGTHTMTATATDNAGRTATATRTYTVRSWNLTGLYAPVDYGTIGANNVGSVVNTVKNGSTVPLKFEVFKRDAAGTELTDPAIVNTPLKATPVNCTTGAAEDAIELTASGSTSLRYDSTSGQFIYNWKTPAKAGTCYHVSVSTADGSSTPIAQFKLK